MTERKEFNPEEEHRKHQEKMNRISQNFMSQTEEMDTFRKENPGYTGSYTIDAIREYKNKNRSKKNYGESPTPKSHPMAQLPTAQDIRQALPAKPAQGATAQQAPVQPSADTGTPNTGNTNVLSHALKQHQTNMQTAIDQQQARREATRGRLNRRNRSNSGPQGAVPQDMPSQPMGPQSQLPQATSPQAVSPQASASRPRRGARQQAGWGFDVNEAVPTPAEAVQHIQDQALRDDAVWGANFRQNNMVAGIANRIKVPRGQEVDPSFQMTRDDLVGWEDYTDRLTEARSLGELNAIKRKINQELQDREVIRRNPGASMIAGTVASVADLPTLVGGGVGTAIKAARPIVNVGAGALSSGATSAATEGIMHNVQETRTIVESAANMVLDTATGGAASAIRGAGKIAGEATDDLSRRAVNNRRIITVDDVVENVGKDVQNQIGQQGSKQLVTGGYSMAANPGYARPTRHKRNTRGRRDQNG